MESTDSTTCSQQPQPQLPPGFRFHPTDEELVVHYLKKKVASAPLPVSIIADVDLYKFDPWELPAKALFGEQEWYFFSPRDRKYPNGARPNRAATSGYWKATGTDKPVVTSEGTPQKVGVKKALVFYGGKPPKGVKTNWIMHEYRLIDANTNNKPPPYDLPNKKASLRLDDWVLCRIYKKNNTQRPMEHDRDEMNYMMASIQTPTLPSLQPLGHPKPSGLKASGYGAFLINDQTMLEVMMGNDGPSNGSMPPQQPSIVSPNSLSTKRTLSDLYWNDHDHEVNAANSPPTKRFLDDQSNDVTLLTHLPQTPSQQEQQQTILGSIGDGLFRQPYQVNGMNWFT